MERLVDPRRARRSAPEGCRDDAGRSRHLVCAAVARPVRHRNDRRAHLSAPAPRHSRPPALRRGDGVRVLHASDEHARTLSVPPVRARGAAACAHAIADPGLRRARDRVLPQPDRHHTTERCLVLGVARHKLRYWRRRVQPRALFSLRPLDAPRRHPTTDSRTDRHTARTRVCHSRPQAVSRGWVSLISMLAAAVSATAVLVAFTARGAAPAPAAVSIEPAAAPSAEAHTLPPTWIAGLRQNQGGRTLLISCLDTNGDARLDAADGAEFRDLDVSFVPGKGCVDPTHHADYYEGTATDAATYACGAARSPLLVVAVGGGGTDL